MGIVDFHQIPWQSLNYKLCFQIQQKLLETHNARTTNKIMSALKGSLKQARKMGLITAEQCFNAIDGKNLKYQKENIRRAVTPEELVHMLNSCPDTPRGKLERVLIAVMFCAGPRRSELQNFDISDFDSNDYSLTIRHGKGDKGRIIYVKATAAQKILDEWIEARGKLADSQEGENEFFSSYDAKERIYRDSGPLFIAVLTHDSWGKEKVNATRISGENIALTIKRVAKRAGLTGITCHALRRGFATELLNQDADMLSVSKLLGHSSVNVVQSYDMRGEPAKQKAAALIQIDYNGPQTS